MKSGSQQLRSQKTIPTKWWVFHGDESQGIKSVKITWKNKHKSIKSQPRKRKKHLHRNHEKWIPKKVSTGRRKKKSIHKKINLDVSKNRGGPPKWMVKIIENLIKMDDLGGKPTIFGNIHFGASPLHPFFFFHKFTSSAKRLLSYMARFQKKRVKDLGSWLTSKLFFHTDLCWRGNDLVWKISLPKY